MNDYVRPALPMRENESGKAAAMAMGIRPSIFSCPSMFSCPLIMLA
jgi:hypothetical protein